MQKLTLLGATGSIGASTLDVIQRHPERFSLWAVSAHRQLERLAEIITKYQPAVAVVADAAGADRLATLLAGVSHACLIRHGAEALCEIASAPQVDTVMAAIVGAAGLAPTLAAARAGKRVLLANKESLVMSGDILLEAVRSSGATLLPIDSEHNAVFQSLPDGFPHGLDGAGVRRILLTASGGPFRIAPLESLHAVTPEQAVAHPNWVMGRKISVDSATMMNKGLEVIEAHWLFGVGADRIDVVVHPQSVIHSMVEYADGSVIAQLGNPDMRTPIAHALAYPERIESGVASLDFMRLAGLCFEAPDLRRFPCLRLAYEALKAGGTASAILNAANEEAVAAFLDRRLGFTGIAHVVEACLDALGADAADCLDSVLAADARAREQATTLIAARMH
ncbi:1-deoxy-D-xylulose-5-phosphate reductoisomerase [Niveibacterium sp. SC-1]|uniref:1-deoxy-D-xylulose-5-phosphate reductoisomerase n=1 Tax=Niveibacterium sp. SC-1 TaxID=3135646 RepID=UPI00311E922D